MNDTNLTTSGATTGSLAFQCNDLYTGDLRARESHKHASTPYLNAEETFSSNATLGHPAPRSDNEHRRENGKGKVNTNLLQRAIEIVNGLDTDDAIAYVVDLEALRGIVLELWSTAATSSTYSQELLATLEGALLSVDLPTPDQVSAFREALRDLRSDVITEAHVDVIRRRFIAAGFSPLGLLTDAQIGNDDDD